MKSPRWLEKYQKNHFSQFGEDGILEKVLSILPKSDKWCVEFGAWDGIEFSNTRHLISDKNWSAVLIEPNPRKFKTLQKNNQEHSNVHLLKEFITFSGKNSLDNLLNTTPIPREFDLLSIDIDGNDYHIWKTVRKYRPKVVIIEFNPTIPPDIEFVQPADFSVNQGTSLLSLFKLAKKKGYELVACTEANGIFVRKKYYPLFQMSDNSPGKMLSPQFETRVFQLFDGTLKVVGCQKLLWSDIPFGEKDIQVLPAFARVFPEGYWKIFLLRVYRWWRTL